MDAVGLQIECQHLVAVFEPMKVTDRVRDYKIVLSPLIAQEDMNMGVNYGVWRDVRVQTKKTGRRGATGLNIHGSKGGAK